MTYASLHTHSHFSADGVGTIKKWVTTAKQNGLYGLAITDHGNCSSMMELYSVGKDEKFPVMGGCELYLVESLESKKKYYHITVLVKNFEGYKNLCKLTTMSYKRDGHFYYKPRVSFAELFDHKEGLIVGSGCLAGPLCSEIVKDNSELANEYVKTFHDHFKEDYYIELQPSLVMEESKMEKNESGITTVKAGKRNLQEVANRQLLEFSNKYNIPYIITPDSHMPTAKMKIVQDIKLHSRSGGEWDFDQSYHLFDKDELTAQISKHHSYLLPHLDEAIKNTRTIMDMGQFKMPEFEPLLPKLQLSDHPLYEDGDTDNDILIKILKDNGRIDFDNEEYIERLKYETATLFKNGKINFISYFLLLEDVVRWCKANDIVIGPGRGSASGSLLAYGLGITQIDPIKYNLSFDRFINKARIIQGTPPDIDTDFSDSEKVKQYVKTRYGEDYVATIGVFQTFKSKGALKDALKYLRPEMTFEQVNALTTKIATSPQGGDELVFFHEQLEAVPELNDFICNNMDVYECVIQLLGQSRQWGRHACSVAISPKPLTDVLPLWYDNGDWVTQYSADWCKKVGVVKYDFLGLNTLNDIAKCVQMIKQRYGIDIDPYTLPTDDKKTYEAFNNADTDTIFQYHTPIAKELLKSTPVGSIDGLAVITAVGRKGPMDVGMDKEYVNRKNGISPVVYPHSSLKDILKDTYGVICYQEQIMSSFQILGGFTAEESDDVRRAMGSKNIDLLNSFKDRFIENTVQKYNDIDTKKAEDLWKLIESFAGYGFNKSHSIAYGFIGYICQYLRQHYPLEWNCAVFSNGDKEDRKALYPQIRDTLQLPDINRSKKDFYIDNNKIVMALTFINGVGDKCVDEIIKCQPFVSFDDFIKRVKRSVVRKDVIINLIFANAFKELEPEKNYQDLLDQFFKSYKAKDIPKEYQHMTQLQILQKELDSLPIQDLKYEEIFYEFVNGEVDSYDYINEKAPDKKSVSIVGKIEKVIIQNTKKQEKMCKIHLSNENRKIVVILWPEQYRRFANAFKEEDIVQVWGKVNIYNNTVNVVMNKITPLKI